MFNDANKQVQKHVEMTLGPLQHTSAKLISLLPSLRN